MAYPLRGGAEACERDPRDAPAGTRDHRRGVLGASSTGAEQIAIEHRGAWQHHTGLDRQLRRSPRFVE